MLRPLHDSQAAVARRQLAGSLIVIAAGIVPAGAQSTTTVRDDQPPITVVVMPFDFAAPQPVQPRVIVPHRPRLWPPMIGQSVGGGGAPFFAPRLASNVTPAAATHPDIAESGQGTGDEIGIGVADLLVERLLAVPGFRIVERRRFQALLAEHRLGATDSVAREDTAAARVPSTMLRARYLITGSVTRFGTEDRRGLGGLGGAFGLGALGLKRPKTQVTLTARVIDATTGEIVASVTGSGTSTKGGGVLIAGAGGGVAGGVGVTSNEFRASALGEATERAVEKLAQALVAQRPRMQ